MQFPKTKTIELELTSKCTIKCPNCPRTYQAHKRNLWDNGHIDSNKVNDFLKDVSPTLVLLTGAYGDGLYHPNLVDVIKKIKSIGSSFVMDTNGSYRKESDWQEIAQVMSDDDTVTFSIDGTPTNFTQYRVNADWTSIEKGIKILTKANKYVIWKYIVFKYNSSIDSLKEAYEKAKELNVSRFQIIDTHRAPQGQLVSKEDFDKNTKLLKSYVDKLNTGPELIISGTLKKHLVDESKFFETDNVRPKCMNSDNFQNFISSEGLFLPCCYMRVDQQDHFKDAGLSKKDIESMSIYTNTYDEIIKGPGFSKIMQNFDNIEVCRRICTKSKLKRRTTDNTTNGLLEWE